MGSASLHLGFALFLFLSKSVPLTPVLYSIDERHPGDPEASLVQVDPSLLATFFPSFFLSLLFHSPLHQPEVSLSLSVVFS